MAKSTQEQQAQQTETGSLKDFAFDTGDSWFGIKEEADTVAEVIKEVKNPGQPAAQKAEEISKTKSKAEEEAEEEEVTFFETDEEKAEKAKKAKATPTTEDDDEDEDVETAKETKEEKDKEDDDEPSDEDAKVFTQLSKELKEKGFFTGVEIKDGEEIPEDKFFDLVDGEVEARVNETFEGFFGEMDEDGKAFLKFKKAGGKTADFFATYNNQFDTSENFNAEDEKQVEKVLTHYLSTVEKLDAADLQDRLAWLKESGKQKVYAKKYHDNMKAEEAQAKANIVAAQEQAQTKREADAKLFNSELATLISKTESVGGFTLTEKDKKELPALMTKPTVKVGKNKYVPSFQAKIADIFKADTPEKMQRLIILGKLVESDFDTTDLINETQTKVTKKVKSKVAEVKRGIKPSGTATNKKSLGDFFDG